jgi:hypothetical protein
MIYQFPLMIDVYERWKGMHCNHPPLLSGLEQEIQARSLAHGRHCERKNLQNFSWIEHYRRHTQVNRRGVIGEAI